LRVKKRTENGNFSIRLRRNLKRLQEIKKRKAYQSIGRSGTKTDKNELQTENGNWTGLTGLYEKLEG
jgi:hypothetical protein